MSAITPPEPRPLFLAPHYDDVALSCGGTVAALAAAGPPPLIVTCFGGAPSGPLSAFARFQHARWGVGPDDAVCIRRAEERAAAAALGAEARWLDLRDAIYRGTRYTSDDELFGPIHPDDRGLVDELVAAVAALAAPGAALYVPLGVGNHVDHQLVTLAGQRLAARGHPVLAYEDFPYAGDPAGRDALQARAAAVAGGPPQTRFLTPAQLAARVRAIRCYRSQLPVIFRHQGDPAAATRRYACVVGDGRPAERFWPLRPADR
ncbi:MAG: PIG-L family deacetylase [Sphaerobacter sp.]|nr:PIG-L family deacetylase [Sphaerobacter sp.]